MKVMKYIYWLMVMMSIIAFSQAQARQVFVRVAPPAKKVVVVARPTCPYPHGVWIDGYWQWRDGRYVWIDGHWVKARPGYVWIAGHWRHTRQGWEWIPGRWHRV